MNSQEKEQVKSLWKRCFHDSEAFVDFYFTERYNDAVSRTLYHEGKVVAALQAIPYPMTFYGDTIATAIYREPVPIRTTAAVAIWHNCWIKLIGKCLMKVSC